MTAVEQIDELIALKLKQIELLKELRAALDLAARAGVNPKRIKASGYDQTKDKRLTKWPNHLRQTIRPETNYVVLDDGTRVDLEIDWKAKLDEYKAERKKAEEDFAKACGYR